MRNTQEARIPRGPAGALCPSPAHWGAASLLPCERHWDSPWGGGDTAEKLGPEKALVLTPVRPHCHLLMTRDKQGTDHCTNANEKLRSQTSKGCCGHQAISHFRHPDSERRELGMGTGSSPAAAAPPAAPPAGAQVGENRTRPRQPGAHQRSDFNEPRPLHLPTSTKVLNSLTCDIRFSLINSHLLMFRLPGPCGTTPVPPGSSQAPSGKFRTPIWQAAILASSPQSLPHKHSSQLAGCAFLRRHQ